MTEERSNPEHDAHVSRAYRDAATETTPRALDDAVLREANEAVSGDSWLRYPKTIHWLRPMAWAATIGLSLAIVLELTMSPPMEPDLVTDDNVLRDQPLAAPAERVDTPAAAPAAVGRTVVPETADRQESKSTDAPAPTSDAAPALASDEEVKEELERLMRFEQQEEARSAAREAVAADGVATLQPSAAYAIAVPCGEDETEAPETWLECIERLDEQGRYLDANRERERLAEAFPDFELPAPAN